MKVTKQTFIRKSFVLSDKDARKLYAELSTTIGAPKIQLKCADGFTREFSDLNTLLEFENSPSRQIQSLRFSSAAGNERASIDFSEGSSSTVFISLEGEEEVIIKTNRAIEDRLLAMKPWYAFLTKIDFVSSALILFLCGLIVFQVVIALGLIQEANKVAPPSTPSGKAMGWLVGFGSVAAIFLLGWVFNHLRVALFPVATFAIGQGLKRHENLEKLRWTAFIGLLVSLIAGILIKFL